jgi:hypothetical protein
MNRRRQRTNYRVFNFLGNQLDHRSPPETCQLGWRAERGTCFLQPVEDAAPPWRAGASFQSAIKRGNLQAIESFQAR